MREAKMGFGDEIPKQVWAAAQRALYFADANGFEMSIIFQKHKQTPDRILPVRRFAFDRLLGLRYSVIHMIRTQRFSADRWRNEG